MTSPIAETGSMSASDDLLELLDKVSVRQIAGIDSQIYKPFDDVLNSRNDFEDEDFHF